MYSMTYLLIDKLKILLLTIYLKIKNIFLYYRKIISVKCYDVHSVNYILLYYVYLYFIYFHFKNYISTRNIRFHFNMCWIHNLPHLLDIANCYLNTKEIFI